MRKLLVCIFLTITGLTLFGEEMIPVPVNNQLYTKFTFQRTSPYLKKAVTGEGYIVMNGSDNFMFRQTKPAFITIRRTDKGISYQKDSGTPFVITASDSMDDGNIAVLFSGDNTKIGLLFDITHSNSGGMDRFVLIPKKDNSSMKTVSEVQITSKGDKIESITITYKNKSVISYAFSDTVTGQAPDETYFN